MVANRWFSKAGYWLVQFPVLVPLTLVLDVLLGSCFTLPPGPLCDEGMVLFLEGGCDWAGSNIFFFSKISLLLTINLAFLVASRLEPLPPRTFVPHLLLLAFLGLAARSGQECDTYYSHPNGSFGQMVLEAAAFAILGLALLPKVRAGSFAKVLVACALWNIAHVALFYLWLPLADHWTWWHTTFLCASLLAAAAVVSARRPLPKKPLP